MSQTSSPITVVIVEARQLLRESLRCLISAMPDLSVIGDVGLARDVVAAVEGLKPQVVVQRFDPTDEISLALMEQLPLVTPLAPTLVIASSSSAAVQAQVVECGGRGVMSCSQPGSLLGKAIRKVHAGELWLERAQTAGLVAHLTGHEPRDREAMKIAQLTAREREIVLLVTEGLDNAAIAERLNIRHPTVRNHLTSILRKLELADRFQLAVYAFRRGLVTCPQPAALPRMHMR